MAAKIASDELTTRHVVYLVLMHTIGAMILDAGINFGLATAMYKNTKDVVTIWKLPNTLAGDTAVTIILQTTLTWILDRLAVKGDVKKGLVSPLRMPADPFFLIRWLVGLEFDPSKPENKSRSRWSYIYNVHIKRIVVCIILTFILYWGICVGILIGLKNHGVGADPRDLEGAEFNVWPFPEIYKGVLGAVLGLTTPLMSYCTLIWIGETAPLETIQGMQVLSEASGGEEEQQLQELNRSSD